MSILAMKPVDVQLIASSRDGKMMVWSSGTLTDCTAIAAVLCAKYGIVTRLDNRLIDGFPRETCHIWINPQDWRESMRQDILDVYHIIDG